MRGRQKTPPKYLAANFEGPKSLEMHGIRQFFLADFNKGLVR